MNKVEVKFTRNKLDIDYVNNVFASSISSAWNKYASLAVLMNCDKEYSLDELMTEYFNYELDWQDHKTDKFQSPEDYKKYILKENIVCALMHDLAQCIDWGFVRTIHRVI